MSYVEKTGDDLVPELTFVRDQTLTLESFVTKGGFRKLQETVFDGHPTRLLDPNQLVFPGGRMLAYQDLSSDAWKVSVEQEVGKLTTSDAAVLLGTIDGVPQVIFVNPYQEGKPLSGIEIARAPSGTVEVRGLLILPKAPGGYLDKRSQSISNAAQFALVRRISR